MNLLPLFENEPATRVVEKGQIVLHEGQLGDTMYVVLDGYVEITSRGHLLDVIGPGGSFGEMALVDNGPRSATARARTDCKFAIVDKARFESLVRSTPEFAIAVMKTMAHRLRREMQLNSP